MLIADWLRPTRGAALEKLPLHDDNERSQQIKIERV